MLALPSVATQAAILGCLDCLDAQSGWLPRTRTHTCVLRVYSTVVLYTALLLTTKLMFVFVLLSPAHTGRPIRLAPVAAYNPARKDQDDKGQKQRHMNGYSVPLNKADEAESLLTFVALLGYYLTGIIIIVPEMHIFAPAIYRAMTGQ